VAPGVTTFDTAGHTPGHISEHIGSGSEEMLLTGDVVVNSAVGSAFRAIETTTELLLVRMAESPKEVTPVALPSAGRS
jgi:glyoxylase-like metal-dependent hydrolase (beta-lactamase superfamily II)